ncbi:Uma2 family endonuclease [Microcoleus sp. LEGE 07076]|uniref:Uma2 family endonuclease n=1 Tax=Microcoleus sp. LEGE 07076 TaxID=915322 RepID=UPI00187F2E03|nr:Uma2 family endonuclease [Microcoleus sp. LEGE 07076]MBE9185729.1 Uma2 family endonuclease [Microcoleus sp. LEGE 07076]
MQVTKEKIIYPSSDGQPMADSTTQFDLMVKIQAGCESLFKKDPNVFVAADLLWYPVEGRNDIFQAPDTMVIFGRPKGDRLSYLQFREDNIAPQFVFEIRSYKDTQTKMDERFSFYNRYGVEEYYVYELDEDEKDLSGWQRMEGNLEVIEQMRGWVSPRLGIRFELGEDGLEIYKPDGQKFLSYLELVEQIELNRQRRQQAVQRAEQESQRAERLAAKLRELNIDPDRI